MTLRCARCDEGQVRGLYNQHIRTLRSEFELTRVDVVGEQYSAAGYARGGGIVCQRRLKTRVSLWLCGSGGRPNAGKSTLLNVCRAETRDHECEATDHA